MALSITRFSTESSGFWAHPEDPRIERGESFGERTDIFSVSGVLGGFFGFVTSRFDAPKGVFNVWEMSLRGVGIGCLVTTTIAMLHGLLLKNRGAISSFEAPRETFRSIMLSAAVSTIGICTVFLLKDKYPEDLMLRGGITCFFSPLFVFIFKKILDLDGEK